MSLKEIFEEEKIEYFGTVPYASLREINQRARGRIHFEPRSVTVFLLPYYVSEGENISKYATSLDYHIAVKDFTDRIIAKLSKLFPKGNFVGFGDSSPIDERYAAAGAGLGVIGDNGLLINEKYGSFVFLCEIISDLDYEALGGAKVGEVGGCAHCGKCKSACPTGILRSEGDSCLSEITQRKGELSEEELALMREYNTVWGCDICQNVCPYNKNPKATPIEFFRKDRITRLTKEVLESMSEPEFKTRAFSWRGRGVLERNLKNESKCK